MKTTRAILIGIVIWIFAILFYSISNYIPITKDAENQANVVLFFVIIPLVWIGTAYYYKKDRSSHGFLVGLTMLLTAVTLDALITVPLFVMPLGGDHYNFFISLGFWIIAFEFLLVSVLYYYTKIYKKKIVFKK